MHSVVMVSSTPLLEDGNGPVKTPGVALKQGITFFGGFVLIYNNACGAGIPSIPLIFAEAGWGISTITMAFFWIASSLASTMIVDAIRAAPRKEDGSCVELTGCARYYTGRAGYIISQTFLFLSIQSLNVASIIISAQAFDQMFVDGFGKTCGIGKVDNTFGISCPNCTAHDSPFASSDIVLSAGFVTAAVVTIPLGYWDLEENIIVQIVCFYLTFVCLGSWFYSMWAVKEFEAIPFSGPNWSQLSGTMLYNFAYVVTIPSWYNEKATGVSVKASVWLASTTCFVSYMAIGLAGGSVYLHTLSDETDLLAALNHDGLARAADYFFPIMAALSGVPIFSIIMRCNLLEGGLCKPLLANFVAVVLPWIVALPFQTGGGLQKIINLSALLFSSVINYMIPFACVFAFARRAAASKTSTLRGVVGRGSSPKEWSRIALALSVSVTFVTIRALYDARSSFWQLFAPETTN